MIRIDDFQRMLLDERPLDLARVDLRIAPPDGATADVFLLPLTPAFGEALWKFVDAGKYTASLTPLRVYIAP